MALSSEMSYTTALLWFCFFLRDFCNLEKTAERKVMLIYYINKTKEYLSRKQIFGAYHLQMNFAMYNDNFFGQYLIIIPDEVKIKIVLQSVNCKKLEHFAIFLQ